LKIGSEYISRIGRTYSDKSLANNKYLHNKLNELRKNGFVALDHLVNTPLFLEAQNHLVHDIENEFNFEYPCLAQSKINHIRDKDLIDANFLRENQELKKRNLTFDRKEVISYNQLINDFKPSTLKLKLPSHKNFYDIWLDEKLIDLVSAYMGFVPHLVEAYVRRNFPCQYKVMNHNWHRDSNHDKYLLKAFIFFTDCDIKTGAHHYISGSISNPGFRDKTYYTDEEVHAVWPFGSDSHMISKVKAGTIILEDTRGLHKAGIPIENYRDLGFAVFLPPNLFRTKKSYYTINSETYVSLSQKQRSLIPSCNLI